MQAQLRFIKGAGERVWAVSATQGGAVQDVWWAPPAAQPPAPESTSAGPLPPSLQRGPEAVLAAPLFGAGPASCAADYDAAMEHLSRVCGGEAFLRWARVDGPATACRVAGPHGVAAVCAVSATAASYQYVDAGATMGATGSGAEAGRRCSGLKVRGAVPAQPIGPRWPVARLRAFALMRGARRDVWSWQAQRATMQPPAARRQTLTRCAAPTLWLLSHCPARLIPALHVARTVWRNCMSVLMASGCWPTRGALTMPRVCWCCPSLRAGLLLLLLLLTHPRRPHRPRACGGGGCTVPCHGVGRRPVCGGASGG